MLPSEMHFMVELSSDVFEKAAKDYCLTQSYLLVCMYERVAPFFLEREKVKAPVAFPMSQEQISEDHFGWQMIHEGELISFPAVFK